MSQRVIGDEIGSDTLSQTNGHAATNGHSSNGSSGPFTGYYSGENIRVGDQGEYYCRSLYGLMKHPNGDRRPDLISVNGDYNPKFAMEVKTSKTGRGVVNPYGLTYGFTSNLDFVGTFGDCIPKQRFEDAQQALLDVECDLFRNPCNAAFYYNLMHRTDGLTTKELARPYDDLAITFGDQMILPHDLILYSYVVGKMRGKGLEFNKAFASVGEIIVGFMTQGYNYSHPNKNDCQAVHFNDFLSLFMGDRSLLRTDEAKERVDLLVERYGDDRLTNLEKMTYVGPNDTRIYAFYRPEHSSLFQEQLKSRIAQRRDVLTRLTRKRQHALSELPESYVKFNEATHDYELKDKNPAPKVLSQETEANLERLLQWKRVEDNGHEFSDVHPASVDQEVQHEEQAAIF